MDVAFFYISIVLVIVVFLLTAIYKKPALPNIIIGIASIGYSLIFEMSFGEILNLYYYIQSENSIFYILLSSIFLYPLLNMLYTLFLPSQKKKALHYSIFWIIAMLVFEYLSILTKTIVLTGWQPLPWSVLTYIGTYAWIYYFYRYLLSKLQ